MLLFFCGQAEYVLLQAVRYSHYQHERQARNPNKFRDTLCISRTAYASLQWIKKDEIRINGRMFDVKRQLPAGDSVRLVGHYDTKDDRLLSVTFHLFDDIPSETDKKNTVKMLAYEATLQAATALPADVPEHKTRQPNVYTTPPANGRSADPPFQPPRTAG